jgi:ABC transporter substrate binding protein
MSAAKDFDKSVLKTHTSAKCRNVENINLQQGIEHRTRSIIRLHDAQFLRDVSRCAAGAGVFAQPRPICDIGRTEIPQRSSLLLVAEVCCPFGWKHGRSWAVKRREFITLLGGAAAAWPFAAHAQRVSPVRLVGVLAQDLQPGLLDLFRDELRNLGYVEGSSINIEVRNAAGASEQLPALADDLLRLKVDVILAVNTPAAQAAQKATKSVPIVIMRVADPVKSGLVASLARPGGNVTGLSFMPDELGAKGIELFREALPGISRMGALYQGDNSGALVVVKAVESRATQLGLQVIRLPVADPKHLPGAFETAPRARKFFPV